MNHYKKVYVYCPPNVVTGGPETHHNVVSVINESGGDAYIFYNDDNAVVPVPYTKYNIQIANTIEDSEENLLIVCEMFTDMLFKYKHIHKAVMFLSLEYFLSRNPEYKVKEFISKRRLPRLLYWPIYQLCRIIKPQYNYKKIDFNDPYLIVTCNGEVNKRYLIEHYGVDEEKIGYICGPINTEFTLNLEDSISKEDVVVYNPKKGIEFTNKIIQLYERKYANVKFVPLENMNAIEVHDLLKKAKVYIDFGNHPGPERIPREAVISYCNIITSLNGSAKYYNDVPISSSYKIEDKEENLTKICDLINSMVVNYEQFVGDFDEFRNKVLNQPNIFKKNVLELFYTTHSR